jgi:hypothetical protein
VTDSNSSNVLDYAPWADSGGGSGVTGTNMSGNNATGVTVTLNSGSVTSGVCSAPTRSDGFGVDQKIVVTPSSSPKITVGFNLVSTARFTLGGTYFFEFELTMSGVTGGNLQQINTLVFFTIDGNNYNCGQAFYPSQGTTANLPADVTAMRVRTPDFVVPQGSAMSGVSATVVFQWGAGTTVTTINVGRAQFPKVS